MLCVAKGISEIKALGVMSFFWTDRISLSESQQTQGMRRDRPCGRPPWIAGAILRRRQINRW